MKIITLSLLVIATLLNSCGNNDKKATVVAKNPDVKIDSSLVTDSSWGLIKKGTDITGLQAIYGAANVMDERICGPECADSIDVTRIYPEQPNQFIVYWKDNQFHKTIAFIETYLPDGPYHSDKGLKIGSTLEELLKINGKQIIFSGFDWDYGGSILDYGMGALQNSPLGFRLAIDEDGGTSLSGDEEFNTDMTEVKKNMTKIKISTLKLSFSKDQ
ncbi:MAG: hypothetical protein SGI83_10705 [Bacteroidota bacterium]|nr:hypothetical protein [Bacteroidota bacterium]